MKVENVISSITDIDHNTIGPRWSRIGSFGISVLTLDPASALLTIPVACE